MNENIQREVNEKLIPWTYEVDPEEAKQIEAQYLLDCAIGLVHEN